MSKKKTTTKKTSPRTSSPAAPGESGFPALARAVEPAAESPPSVAVSEPPLPIQPAPTPAEIAAMPLKEATMPDPAAHREQTFDEPDPVGPPQMMAGHIDETVEPLTAVEPELGEYEVHPEIKLPMVLIRDKNRMVKYAQAIGRDTVEAQSRREKLKLTPQVMYLYRHYKKYCENHGMRYWTERGFASTLVCFHRGVPLEEPEQEPEQDILERISQGVTREQSRK